MEINSFFLWDTTDKEGEATSWPDAKHVYSDENLSKLCAESAIQNLLNMLHFSQNDMNIFWELATSDLNALMNSLKEEFVPKAVLKPSLQIDLIQKCLWILRKKFKFQTTKKVNKKNFQCLKQSLNALLEIEFSHVDFSWKQICCLPACGCCLERDGNWLRRGWLYATQVKPYNPLFRMVIPFLTISDN
jgi:hypothetical protein